MGNRYASHRALVGLAVAAALSAWTAAAAQGLDISGFQDRVLALLNQQRATNGLSPLQREATLDSVAQAYSQAMMQATAAGPVYLSHTGPDGSTLARRVSAAGYAWNTLGEDLGAGQRTPEQVVAAWMGSPEHRDNILDPDFSDVGIGLAVGPGTWPDGHLDPQVIWWTVDFGEPSTDSLPTDTPTAPPPAITGYTTLAGTPISQAPFGTLLLVKGQNLGISGTLTFDGQPATPISWSPTSIMTLVPLQAAYPDAGPVNVTVGGQTTTGPGFTTVQPLDLTPLRPNSGPPSGSGTGAGGNGAPAPPTISGLENGNKQPVSSVLEGMLLFIRGRGFGTNPQRRGRAVFSTADGTQFDGGIWDWADDRIAVFAPFFHGPVLVGVQVNANGTASGSNRVPLSIQ
jgi:uncharacterized protein YkwD